MVRAAHRPAGAAAGAPRWSCRPPCPPASRRRVCSRRAAPFPADPLTEAQRVADLAGELGTPGLEDQHHRGPEAKRSELVATGELHAAELDPARLAGRAPACAVIGPERRRQADV